MTDSTSLTCNATTVYTAYDIELISCSCKSKRLTNDKFKCFKTEIIVDISVVDCDFTSTCIYTYSCY